MPASAQRRATVEAWTSEPPASTSSRTRHDIRWMRRSPAEAAMSPSLATVPGSELRGRVGPPGSGAPGGAGAGRVPTGPLALGPLPSPWSHRGGVREHVHEVLVVPVLREQGLGRGTEVHAD